MNPAIKEIILGGKNYPPLLGEIPAAPAKLHYLGTLPAKSSKMIAIVGTRKATEEGKAITRNLAKVLSQKGFEIVSGLALGIDGAAHEGALEVGGKTVAVLGNGLPEIYPKTHDQLGRRIIEHGGCIFSEYENGAPSLPHQFLERNRIISGLSVATIVVESPIRSGALVTARFAIEQGREVFVVPGPANHPNYRGSHMLIRNGARLVTNTADILEDLGISEISSWSDEILTPHGKSITETIKKNGSASVHKIIEETRIPAHIVNQELTFMLFQGVIKEKNGDFELKSR